MAGRDSPAPIAARRDPLGIVAAVAASGGLFVAGFVSAVVAVVVLGRLAAAADGIGGWVRVGLVFGLVGLPAVALTGRRQSRAFGLGALAGTTAAFLLMLWFVGVFHIGADD